MVFTAGEDDSEEVAIAGGGDSSGDTKEYTQYINKSVFFSVYMTKLTEVGFG